MTRDYQIPTGAIGWKEDFSPEALEGKIISGETGAVFETEDDYLNHQSPISGFKPTEAEFFGEHYKLIQQGALKRGDARKED